MLKWLLGLTGAVIAIAPAQASVTERAAFDHAASHGTIEALEAFAHQFPRTTLLAALKAQYAKFECNSGDLHRCGADGSPVHQSHRGGYGG